MGTMVQFCPAISSQLRHISTIGKKWANRNISSRRLHNMVNFGLVMAEIGSVVWGTQLIATGLASCLRYCSDVAHRRPTKLCRMVRYIHIFGVLAPDGILPVAKFTLLLSLAFSYIGSVTCTALQQRALAKLCGVAQGMELQNFRRGRHLYLAVRPSRWASAHILVVILQYDGLILWG